MTERGDRRLAGTLANRQDTPDDQDWAAAGAVLADTTADRNGAALPPAIRQVVFIDAAVPDAQALADGVAPGVLAVLLNPASDGVQQIATWLAGHHAQGLAAIDIVAHGEDGLITLGNAVLDAATLPHYQSALATIGAALQPGGEIQLYGCDVAQDATGTAFLQQLSDATGGASVAAASHIVGAAADGGSWNLDFNTGTVAVAAPFTAATMSAYPDALAASGNQLYVTFNAGLATNLTRIEQLGVSGATATSSSILVSNATANNFHVIEGLAIDAARGKYYVSDNDGNTTDAILAGPLGGTPTVIYSQPDLSNYAIGGIALDEPNGYLYFGLGSTGATDSAILAPGIYKIDIRNGNSVTAVATTRSGSVFVPGAVALDTPDNLVFFADTDNNNQTFNNLDVAINGSITVLNSQLSSAVQTILSTSNANESFLSGVAVDAATHTLFVTAENGTAGGGYIFSIPFTVAASSVTLGTVTTLASGAAAEDPDSIVLDTQNSLFYIGSGNSGTSSGIYEGSMAGGGLTRVFQETTSAAPAAGMALLSTPTIVASGTISYNQNASATTLDAGATVTDADGQDLASATVAVAGGSSSFGDTLAATVAGTSITQSYNASTETLTLSGVDTIAHYQQVLDSVTFKSTGATAGTRTIDWTVSDGVITSATATSSVTVHDAPVITAGTTVTFTGGGSPVVLDSGLSITDASGTTLASATVVIGGFIAGDTLTVGAPGGLASSFNNGTLTLSGSAAIATYKAALDSVAYSFNPSNGDPTGGGGNTTRTIAWSANNGFVTSTAATSTLDVTHVAPTVTAGASVTYPENAAPLVLDAGLTVTDPDSGGLLTGATVAITSGFLSGDQLHFTDQSGITGNYNATTGVLTLSGSATIAQYQAALQSVAYDFPGDPTNHLADNGRTISWTVTDGVGTSTAVTSSLTVLCFCAGTQIATPEGARTVDDLHPGDLVLTASGTARPIVWIGVGRQLVTRGRRTAATPVIVERGALAHEVPYRDLRLTKAHALLVDGVLIPVEFLVNHRSIRWDDRAQEVTLYHIELASHDVLIADGAPAESYRDDGNRWLFQNANSGWGLPPQEPCAPVLTGGPIVDAAWRRFLDRSGPRKLPPLTDDPDLHLLVDGRRIDAVARQGQSWRFRLPASPATVRIVSRDAVPAELGLVRDFRPLGVALRRITLYQAVRVMVIEAADARLGEGCHGYEPAEDLRWTNGDAALPEVLVAAIGSGAELVLELAGATQYPLFGGAERASAA